MNKSLLITYFFPPKLGGIENYLRNFCRNVPEEQICVLTEPHPSSKEEDQRHGFKVIRQPLFPWKFMKPSWLPLVWRLKKIIDQEKSKNLLFGHYSNLVTLGLIYKKIFNIPYFIFTHGVDTLLPQKKWFQNKLMRRNLKNAEWIIANTRYMKKRLIDIGIVESKIVIIYPSISSHKYRDDVDTNKLAKKYDLGNKKVILTMGRLIERKGHDTVIKSLPEVLSKIPETRYVIVGDGPDRSSLESLVRELSLTKQVIFTGPIEDKIELKLPFYNLADLFIMPTREMDEEKDIESFGLVYLEAQASGCPVIIGKAGGTSETIIEGETGLSVNPENTKAVSKTIKKLLLDEKMAREMGEKGKKWVRGTFNWENQINKFKFLLEKPYVKKENRENPAISVIIPAYNVENYIDDCLESVFFQTFDDYEVIVVNDGSKDGLLNKLEKYTNKIQVINQDNLGAAIARNKGADLARGEYLFFCDADAKLKPKALETMIRVLELNQFAAFCYSAFYFGRRKFKALPFSSERLKKYNYIDTMSLVRKKLFLGFDEKLNRFQDWDLWLRIVLNGKRGIAVDKILFSKPFRKEGISKSVPKREAEQIIRKKHNL